jgi:hypothetical protein
MNRLLKSWLFIVLLSAHVHLLILFGHALFTWDAERINYYKILDLQLIFKNILNGPNVLWVSALVALIIFGLCYVIAEKVHIKLYCKRD